MTGFVCIENPPLDKALTLIIGIGYLILFFIVLTPDINNAVGRGIQALLFCILGYRCEENIRRFIKNR